MIQNFRLLLLLCLAFLFFTCQKSKEEYVCKPCDLPCDTLIFDGPGTFYDFSKKRAAELEFDFNWNFKTIPNVGHDFRAMSEAAASLLYEK